jgi:hypothetical protein
VRRLKEHDMQSTTPGVVPGIATTEFLIANRASWLGIATTILGVIVEAAFQVIELLTPLAPQFSDAKWIGVVLIVAGLITKTAASLGYSRSRAIVKAAAVQGTKLLLLLALFGAAPVFADDPPADPTAANSDPGTIIADAVANSYPDAQRFGGCFRGGSICLGPSVSLSLVAYDLGREQFVAGFDPGVGYGVTVWRNRWHSLGLAANAALSVREGEVDAATLSAVVSFAEYLRMGYGYEIVGARDGVGSSRSQYLLLGVGADFGK